MERLPKQNPYSLLDDLNANLRYPQDDRAVDVAVKVASFGLVDMLGAKEISVWHDTADATKREDNYFKMQLHHIINR
jgi:hypothetical protein